MFIAGLSTKDGHSIVLTELFCILQMIIMFSLNGSAGAFTVNYSLPGMYREKYSGIYAYLKKNF